MLSRIENAQDEFAQLVEQCRNGQVYRCVLADNTTKFYSHQPHVDLDIPVFYTGEFPIKIDNTLLGEVSLAFKNGTFRLPYPRCALMSHLDGHSPAMMSVPRRYSQIGVSRRHLMVAEETETGLLFYSFMRSDIMMFWAKQQWQVFIPYLSDQMEFAYDPEATAEANQDFIPFYYQGTRCRMEVALLDIHRLTSGHGATTESVGTEVSDKIDRRRAKNGHHPVPRVRVIDFSVVPPARTIATPSDGPKATRMPHFRRGTWRTLQTGRKVWVRPCAVHGGSPNAPPWYEVRQRVAA